MTVRSGSLFRRPSLRWTAVGLAVLLALSLVACRRPPQQAAPETGTEPARKLIATYAILSDMTEWDPSITFDQTSFAMLNIYEPLVWFNPPGSRETFTPALAERWEVAPDGMSWTFYLRKGVKFHNGEPFTSEAVKLYVDRTMELNQGAAFIWGAVEAVETPDDHTVVFRLAYPAPMDLVVSAGYGTYIPCPESLKRPDAAEWFARGNACGTGPYRLARWTPGEEVVMERFDDYWGGWQPGQFDLAVIKIVPEWSTQRQMLEAGEIDVTRAVPVEEMDALKANPNLVVRVDPGFQNLLALYNTARKPLDDRLVRQALSHALDYETIIREVRRGLAEQSQGPVPRGIWGHDDQLPMATFDLRKASDLLARAGYPGGGFKLTISYETGDEHERKVAELWKAALAQIGVELEIIAQPWGVRWDRQRNPDTAFDVFLFYWWPTYITPHDWLFSMFHSEEDPFFNLGYYKNPEFDALIDEANALTGRDRERAAELFRRAQAILVEDAAAAFVYDQSSVTAHTRTLKGYVDNPAYPNTVFFYQLRRGN